MKIKLTLICECCNKGMAIVYATSYALQARGHHVDVSSRNCHGRCPAAMGLLVTLTPQQVKKEPYLLLEIENGQSTLAPVATFAFPEGL